MTTSYCSQATPSTHYMELLGMALCVFNSNNAFIIENILRNDANSTYTWHDLVDRTSGNLSSPIKETITKISGTQIACLFETMISKRNRIVHSFQITHDGEQKLTTKDKTNKQFIITESYLKEFIKENGELSKLLHEHRGH